MPRGSPARYLARQEKPWDLMAWSFTIHGEKRNGSNQKSAPQLEREAAEILAQGEDLSPITAKGETAPCRPAICRS